MKKSLFLYALLSATLLAWCTTTSTTTTNTDIATDTNTNTETTQCPNWSEYWETHYDNGNYKSQWCFQIWENVMEWHWTFYFENGWKDSEWEIRNDKREWEWTFYDEEWNNTIEMIGNYKDDLEDWERKYYVDWEYICSDIFSQWELTDEWTCAYEDENDEDADIE